MFLPWLKENSTTLLTLTAYFICEVLAHTSQFKANSLFQLLFGWVKNKKENLPKKETLLLAFLLLGAGASGACALAQTSKAIANLDPQSAIEARDDTGLIEGCGEQLTLNPLVCRKTEGQIADEALTFIGPPVECMGSEPCITFKIFFSDGSPSLGGFIPRGQTRQEVPWKAILKRDTFELGDRGIWGYSYTIRYLDDAGIERKTYSQGEIYLRVIKKGYIPLHSVREDPAFVWKWKEKGFEIKATTGMRTFVEKRKAP